VPTKVIQKAMRFLSITSYVTPESTPKQTQAFNCATTFARQLVNRHLRPVRSENLIRPQILNLQRLAAELLPSVFHALAQFNAAGAIIRHARQVAEAYLALEAVSKTGPCPVALAKRPRPLHFRLE
jgi:hypothetical protein